MLRLHSSALTLMLSTVFVAGAQITVPGSTSVTVPTPAATSPAPPQLSPKAAYDDAMHPLDMTRRSISNWSPAEIAALKVTISQAHDACKARDPHAFTGADLIDYARLCGLGQEWGTVVLATSLYIDAPTTVPKPLLTEAHAARVDADLRLHSVADAIRDTRAMYAAVPYTPLVAEASDEAIAYMTFSTLDDALALAAERQPFILAQLKQIATPAPLPATAAPASSIQSQAAPFVIPVAASPPTRASVHDLYAQGMALATLQQLAAKPEAAATALAELDRSLPTTLNADDTLRIGEDRRRYALLGKPLSGLTLTRSLSMPNTVPAIPALNTVTVLLLFPDWCAACVGAMNQVPETVFHIAGHDAYYYGLLAETVPEDHPSTDTSTQHLAANFNPAYAAYLLAEKPVLTVPPSTLNQFTATDFPFLIVTDAKGVVRVAQPIDTDDMASGGKVDAAVVVVGQNWPLPMPHITPASAPSTTTAPGRVN